MQWLWTAPRRFLAWAISIYQKTLSPDHGLFRGFFPDGYCKFYPSCSEYSKQAILKYGVFRGGLKMVWRILRCNPFNDGGIDEVK